MVDHDIHRRLALISDFPIGPTPCGSKMDIRDLIEWLIVKNVRRPVLVSRQMKRLLRFIFPVLDERYRNQERRPRCDLCGANAYFTYNINSTFCLKHLTSHVIFDSRPDVKLIQPTLVHAETRGELLFLSTYDQSRFVWTVTEYLYNQPTMYKYHLSINRKIECIRCGSKISSSNHICKPPIGQWIFKNLPQLKETHEINYIRLLNRLLETTDLPQLHVNYLKSTLVHVAQTVDSRDDVVRLIYV